MHHRGRRRTTQVSYYDILVVEIYDSAHRHGVDDDTEVVIHAMPIRRLYEGLLPEAGDDDG
jgi:hypothetical protein